jgi:2'-5' RNA ligase
MVATTTRETALRVLPRHPEQAHPTGHDPSSYAVVLHFDEETDRRLREVWAALDVHGVDSVARTHGAAYRPHLTLAIIETADVARATTALRLPLARVAGLPVTLNAVGFFLTGTAPAYLGVTPTSRLLLLHEQVHAAIGDVASWDYYRPGSWVPHCTLAMGVTSHSAVAEVVAAAVALPLHATVSGAHLSRLPGNRSAKLPGQRRPEQQPDSAAEARHRAGPRHKGGRRLTSGLIWR